MVGKVTIQEGQQEFNIMSKLIYKEVSLSHLGLRIATTEDFQYFIPSFEDIEEINYLYGKYIGDLLKKAEKTYQGNWLVIYDLETEVIYAIGGHNDYEPWFITSGVVKYLSYSKKKEFIQILKIQRDVLLDSYGFLTNVMWEDNKLHKHLLRQLGAIFSNNSTKAPYNEYERVIRFFIRKWGENNK